ncbi:MAG TPA: D-alanyl-D-alanine carboxypeptidase [Actinomycetota bacterium]|nr:D-alanyl-D-alanine carboxypeptidase [Actinomycetota bacterium]
MRRAALLLLIACVLATSAPAHARPYWKKRIDHISAGKRIGMVVHDEGRVLYQRAPKTKRAPASNEKLLMSMALFDRLAPRTTIETSAYATSAPSLTGVIEGDLWITGRGDPSVTAGGPYASSLPIRATDLSDLARGIAATVTKIEGRVLGSRGYFARDWFAHGWESYFPATEIALPTALTFNGNSAEGRHVSNPEWRAARALTRRLEALGVPVRGHPASGYMPASTTPVAAVQSEQLWRIVRYMNRSSSNFFAEVLGKRLGAETFGAPGSIAKGADAIEAFALDHNVTLAAYDASGLSYSNRVSPLGIVKLLTAVEETKPYYEVLRDGLPRGGEGTLEDRLHGVKLRAKTGSLRNVSALSGWVWLKKTQSWAAFSILSAGTSYYSSKGLEDRIVRLLTNYAR